MNIFLGLLLMVYAIVSAGATSQRTVPAAQPDDATIPDNLLGPFTNNKDKLNHVTALWDLLQDGYPPLDVSLVKGNTFEFKRWEPTHMSQHSTANFDYQYCFNLGESPSMEGPYKGCIPFKLNMRTAFRINNLLQHDAQIMITLVDGAIRAVIQSPTACGFRTTLMTFVPQQGNIAVSFNGGSEAVYTRDFPEFMFGAFQLVANSTVIDEANTLFQNFSQEKDVLLWTNLTSLWISKTAIHKDNEFLFKIAVSPTKFLHRDYRLVNGTLLDFNGEDMFNLESSRQKEILGVNSIVQEIRLDRTLTSRYRFYQNYMLQTVEIDTEIKIVLNYSRTIPWHLYGTYEEINENGDEQVNPQGDNVVTMLKAAPVSLTEQHNNTRRITISHGSANPRVVFERPGTTTASFPFKLNDYEPKISSEDSASPYHRTSTNSTVSVGGGMGDVLSVVEPRITEDAQIEEMWTTLTTDANKCFGLDMEYKIPYKVSWPFERELQKLKFHKELQQSKYQRVVRSSVFGKFQVSGSDSVMQLIQGSGDRFQFVPPANAREFLTFNTPDETQPRTDDQTSQQGLGMKSRSMWHYVEVYDNVILTVYKTYPGSSDFTRKAAYVVSPDGITLTEFQSGAEYSLTRVV